MSDCVSVVGFDHIWVRLYKLMLCGQALDKLPARYQIRQVKFSEFKGVVCQQSDEKIETALISIFLMLLLLYVL